MKVLRAGRRALALLGRVQASFARAEAVHQARLDAYWAGPDRHLLTHYAWSAK